LCADPIRSITGTGANRNPFNGRHRVTPIESLQEIRLNTLQVSGASAASSRLGTTLAELIDVMDIAMWELDRNYRVVGFNRKAREIYGEKALGKFCYQAAAGLETVCEDCPAEQVFLGQPSGRSEHHRTRVNGETIYIDHIATPIRDKDGNFAGALVLIIDITKQKKLEQELIAHRNDFERKVIERTHELEKSQERFRQLYEESKKSEALYLSLLNAAADAIAITGANGIVRYVNPSFTQIFGWPLPLLTEQHLPFGTCFEANPASTEFRRLMQTGQPIVHLLTKRPTRGGTLLDVSLSIARYEDHQGQPAGIICSYRDITEAKAMEMQLYRAQKFEALGTMAGGIAHDFNNLLMGIQGSASLMLMELQAGGHPFNPEKLKNIEKYVTQGGNLTRQLLTLGKGNRNETRTVDLNILLAGCASLFGRSRRDIVVNSRLQDAVWPVEADAGQIEQVLLNLFVNAAHAMPEGGELGLRTDNIQLDRQAAALLKLSPGRYVKITVTDSGSGIDPAILDRIFDPFFTTKDQNQGTGLGLATAYSIISNHDGLIQAGMAPGGGARFTILLPASDGQVEREHGTVDTFLHGSETILLVDDDERVLQLTGEMLQRLGYTPLYAASGEKALLLFGEHSGRIDLVILDMIMPRMGGAELMRRLSALDPDIKILLSSGYTYSDQTIEDYNQGRCGFIQKPFTLHLLSATIRRLLDA
jgi:two-component system, cell cycle sensor histidine kinase and response regulator CckA